MTAEATAPAVLEELWISFRSVLHAYSAAASLGLSEMDAIGVEEKADEVCLRGPRRSVCLVFAPETAEGRWVISGGDGQSTGSFALQADGTVLWSGSEERPQMDAMAERLTTLVME